MLGLLVARPFPREQVPAANGITVSALARRSGLDPTSFNKSKRLTRDGKPRWPSTESIAKVLAATGCTLSRFVDFIAPSALHGAPRSMPLLGSAEAGRDRHFDEAGYPSGRGWDEIRSLDLGDPCLFALKVVGDGMRPLYRDGDVLLISPAAPVGGGDRVVVKTRRGELLAKEVRRRTPSTVELAALDPALPPLVLAPSEILWMSRIVWASQ
jgi:phage repressor protein C with HTH and peptisase S24 domain